MSRDFQEHIFEAFERDRSAYTIQGTGLGMAITKSIVDMMGGTIYVVSEQGKGTEFIVNLNIRLQDGIMSEEEEESVVKIAETEKRTIVKTCENLSKEDAFLGKRVLLVEDNELNREIGKELLSDAGFYVEEAENGFVAVEKVKVSKKGYYDLILMDVQMPVMNGYEATRAIRNLSKEHSGIPIIAMTANAFKTDKNRAMESGMNAYISKPIVIEELLEMLDVVLRNCE